MKRLLKKIALTEGVDCSFEVQGNQYSGKIFILLNKEFMKNDNLFNPSYLKDGVKENVIAYYSWFKINTVNYFNFMPGEKENFITISGAVEVMEQYRKSQNPKDSIFNNVFDLLMTKLKEVCFEPLIEEFGEDGVFYRGAFVNYDLEQKYRAELKEKYGMEMLTNTYKEKLKKYFNINMEDTFEIGDISKLIYNCISQNVIPLSYLKLILNENRFTHEEMIELLTQIYIMNDLNDVAVQYLQDPNNDYQSVMDAIKYGNDIS